MLGENPETDVFDVEIQDLSKTRISALKKILADYLKTDVPARHIQLHKVHIEAEDCHQDSDFFPGEQLKNATLTLSRHWTPEDLLTGYIHVVVVLPLCAS